MEENKITCPFCGDPECEHTCSEIVIPNWVVILTISATIALMIYNLC